MVRCSFNPRSPRGERRTGQYAVHVLGRFQSTLPARGATSECIKSSLRRVSFNPRSRAGSDRSKHLGKRIKWVSIHAPRAGSDGSFRVRWFSCESFNPRSPRGERPRFAARRPTGSKVSIHAPRAGSDGARYRAGRSCWVSIHAPRAGSDGRTSSGRGASGEFQSTLPARGATAGQFGKILAALFQSTLPARGATGLL